MPKPCCLHCVHHKVSTHVFFVLHWAEVDYITLLLLIIHKSIQHFYMYYFSIEERKIKRECRCIERGRTACHQPDCPYNTRTPKQWWHHHKFHSFIFDVGVEGKRYMKHHGHGMRNTKAYLNLLKSGQTVRLGLR
jgi:hypothetical protein